jgi:SNF2 family DNA or RNA helicase
VGAAEKIQSLVKDITLTMRSEDWVNLPEVIYNEVFVQLPRSARALYNRLEDELFVTLLNGGNIRCVNAGVLTVKLRQLANGCVFRSDEKDTYEVVHDVKLEALDEVIEESNGGGVMVLYQFRPDRDRILERYSKRYRVAYLGPGVKDQDSNAIYEACNRREYDILVTNAQSSGYGLNLQTFGHHMVWVGLNFSAGDLLQAVKRLVRRGQRSDHVVIHTILARDTVDELVYSVVHAKKHTQEDYIDALVTYAKRQRSVHAGAPVTQDPGGNRAYLDTIAQNAA